MSAASDQLALTGYLALREKCWNMQEYTEADKVFKRASLEAAERGCDKYQKRVDDVTDGGPRMVGITPKD